MCLEMEEGKLLSRKMSARAPRKLVWFVVMLLLELFEDHWNNSIKLVPELVSEEPIVRRVDARYLFPDLFGD